MIAYYNSKINVAELTWCVGFMCNLIAVWRSLVSLLSALQMQLFWAVLCGGVLLGLTASFTTVYGQTIGELLLIMSAYTHLDLASLSCARACMNLNRCSYICKCATSMKST